MSTPTGATCPRCGTEYVAEPCDGDERLVTYWAEDGPVEVECESCGYGFQLQEWVSRWWEVVPGDEDGDSGAPRNAADAIVDTHNMQRAMGGDGRDSESPGRRGWSGGDT